VIANRNFWEKQMNKRARFAFTAALVASAWGIAAPAARADETCLSPYTASLIKGQEAYLHVWALC
jgi:selenium-binding protein 1